MAIKGTSGNDVIVGTAQSDVLEGLGGSDSLAGLLGADLLLGDLGNDTLNGGGGADTLIGGLGNDTYVVDDAGDLVWEPAAGGAIVRVSTAADGSEGDDVSCDAQPTPDGRYVVFASYAGDLVAGDGNAFSDVFVKDLVAGTITRVSTAGDGGETNLDSEAPQITADGRYVAFAANAGNLVTGDTNGAYDVFLKDLETGATTRVSTSGSGEQAEGSSFSPRITPDGRYLVFESGAHNLVSGDTNIANDIFRKDLVTGAVVRVSTDSSGSEANDSSYNPDVTTNGRFVAFQSVASDLVASDTNDASDIFVKDLSTGELRRVSTDSGETQGDSFSHSPSITPDGRYVVFSSDSTNLVAGDTNGVTDIFVKDLSTGATVRVSTNGAGTQANDFSYLPDLSADGRYVVFISAASDLVLGDTNAAHDVFVKDVVTGAIARVSASAGGAEADLDSYSAVRITDDGRFITFSSVATNLVDGDNNGKTDVFRAANPLLAGGGIDTVRSSISYTLPDGVENLLLTGSSALMGQGNAGNNAITGNDGDNSLRGADGADILAGGAGNDSYLVDAADVVVEREGGGTDTVISPVSHSLARHVEDLLLFGVAAIDGFGNDLANTVTGNSAANRLLGLAGNDVLVGTGGRDTLLGDTGDDSLVGGAAADSLSGGAGDDTLIGGTLVGEAPELTCLEQGVDTLEGGAGNDLYWVADESDIVRDSEGVDTIVSFANLDASAYQGIEVFELSGAAAILLDGSAKSEVLVGSAGGNEIVGGGGCDRIEGRGGDDVLLTDPRFLGAETTLRAILNEWYRKGSEVLGGEGADTLILGHPNDRGFGGAGNDTLLVAVGHRAQAVYDLPDTLAFTLDGGGGNDTLLGGVFGEQLVGGDGNDVIRSMGAYGEGDLTSLLAFLTIEMTARLLNALPTDSGPVDSPPSVDQLLGFLSEYVAETMGRDPGPIADALAVQQTVGFLQTVLGNWVAGAEDRLAGSMKYPVGDSVDGGAGNDLAVGGAAADRIAGGSGNDTLTGGRGNDRLDGGLGADRLAGGLGNDSLAGGAGQDVFRFDAAPTGATNRDAIGDFVAADDTIQLENAVFTAIATTGALAADAFHKGAGVVAAHDPTDRIVYDTTTGALYYDPDGSGARVKIHFATLVGSPDDLGRADFVVT